MGRIKLISLITESEMKYGDYIKAVVAGLRTKKYNDLQIEFLMRSRAMSFFDKDLPSPEETVEMMHSMAGKTWVRKSGALTRLIDISTLSSDIYSAFKSANIPLVRDTFYKNGRLYFVVSKGHTNHIGNAKYHSSARKMDMKIEEKGNNLIISYKYTPTYVK